MSTGVIIGLIILGLFVLFLVFVAFWSLKIVNQTEFFVVERLGKYHRTLFSGVNFIVPFIDRVVLKENFKEKVIDFPKQAVITKDNATIQVDTVVYLYIVDAKLFSYGVERPLRAIELLTATTLRNLLGALELDQTLTSRDTVNSKLTIILDEASDSWGIKVNRVEIQNIIPPKDIQRSMEKQMQAERERRANILNAEGFKSAAILKAEGEKTAQILAAEASKTAKILRAEAEQQREILLADGQKQAIELLKAAGLTPAVLTWKSLEQLEKVANGQATKIIIPPNLQNLAGTMASFQEFWKAGMNAPSGSTPTDAVVNSNEVNSHGGQSAHSVEPVATKSSS